MRHRSAAGVLLAAGAFFAACSDDGGSALDPGDLAGSWVVSMVVGSVDADPDIEPGVLPGDATFREHWRFEDCDERGCTLRRPDGGILLGDLDDLRLALVTDEAGDGPARLTGTGTGSDPLPLEDATPCDGAETERWELRVEVSAHDRVLSGSVVRIPAAERLVVDGTTCFGVGLSLGLSGIPRADGAEPDQG